MDKNFYKKCIQHEVYKNKNNPISNIIYKYFAASTNCVFLIRKMMYLYSKGGTFNKLRALIIRKKLITKYSVHIFPSVQIECGLYIPHPCAIVINGRCVIGKNFTILQNCTIGVKSLDNEYGPAAKIGNNVKMYANSIILGDINIADDVILGANSMLLKDALIPGVYIGSPAELFIK